MITFSPEGLVRLAAVRDIIRENPHQFIMGDFEYTEDLAADFPQCGTAYCIAGWLCTLNPKLPPGQDPYFSQALALDVLGVEEHYWDNFPLFFVDGWPAQYRDDIDECGETYPSNATPEDIKDTQRVRRHNAHVACSLLDEVIARGGLWYEHGEVDEESSAGRHEGSPE